MTTHFRFPARILLVALVLGVAADQLFFNRWIGISVPLFVGAGLIALFGLATLEQRRAAPANVWLGGAALLFAALVAVRDAPLLVMCNLLAMVGLLVLLVANFRGIALHRLPAAQAAGNAIVACVLVIATPFALLGRSLQMLPAQRMRVGGLAPVARGVALAFPALFVFGGLLAAADSVFASYVWQLFSFSLPIDWNWLVLHGVIVGFVAWACAGGIAAALSMEAATTLPAEGDTQRLHQQAGWRFLGWTESVTVLVAVDLLFGAFMLIQGAYFFGGHNTLARTNMTYAEYARRGFFELVAVACLALALLWLLSVFAKREPGRERAMFNGANVAMVLLVLGMLVSAFQRMWLYEEAYGFTQLRLYTHSFMIWLAVILVLFVVALLRDRPRVFSFGTFAAALVYLALLNGANPDGMIVRANVARYAEAGELDTYYLSTLSADATPDLVAALGSLPPELRDTIVSDVQYQHSVLAAAADQGWPAWSWSRWQALSALKGMKDEG